MKAELKVGKAFVQGYDKKGRPLIICFGRLHSRTTRNLDEGKRFVCYTLDAAIRSNDIKQNPDGKICSIFDLRGEILIQRRQILHPSFKTTTVSAKDTFCALISWFV